MRCLARCSRSGSSFLLPASIMASMGSCDGCSNSRRVCSYRAPHSPSFAYTIRFLAASLSAIEAGSSKISRNIDAAARTLGSSVSELLFKVHLPMPRPALGAAALLVFVDSMKELPATLLLRPFNFDTLANPGLALPLRGSGIVSAHHRVWSAWRQSYSCMVSSREAVREPG